MLKDLIIIGSSGFAKETAWLVRRINAAEPTWNLLGFMDNDRRNIGTVVHGFPVLDESVFQTDYPDAWYVCAIGSSKIRKRVLSKYRDVKFATLIDPDALIADETAVGEGSVICAGSIITVDIKIGRHVIINLDCTVGHDAVLDDYVTLYPGVNISGGCKVGACSEVGTGAHVIQMKTIGTGSIVGAGAVVIRDIADHCVAVGNPAVPIRYFS